MMKKGGRSMLRSGSGIHIWTRWFALSAIVMGVLAVAGCAGLQSDTDEPPELVVRKLSTQRWQALLARDFDKAYSFSTPGYRKLRSLEYFKTNRQGAPVKWLSAEILRVECEKERCKTVVQVESKPTLPFPFRGNITSGLDEVWVFEEQRWWVLESL